MGSPIHVSFKAIEIAADDIRGINTDIKGRLESLKKQIGAVAATWEGQAHTDYQTRQKLWTDAQTELCNLLDQIATALDQTVALYRQTEAKNAGMWAP